MNRLIYWGLAAATVAALFNGCAHYNPSNPGSTQPWRDTYFEGNVFFTKDPTNVAKGLALSCPHGSVKQGDKFIKDDNGDWYVIQRYRCLGPEAK